MEFCVTVTGRPAFTYAAPAHGQNAKPVRGHDATPVHERNTVPVRGHDAAPACGHNAAPSADHCEERCPSMRPGDRCRVLASVAEVLDYFSDVVSYEKVLVACRDGAEAAIYEETGQRAAVRLLLAGMQASGCPFFSRFAALPVDAPLDNAYAALSHLLEALSRTDASTRSGAALGLERLGDALESHLAPLLAEAKRRSRRDAAVNAVILMVSAIRLAVDEVRERPPAAANRSFGRGQARRPVAA
jgi:hypothetical protein